MGIINVLTRRLKMNERVTLVDINIPFGRMVAIIIKWTLAAIPAMILVSIIVSIIFALLTVIFGGLLAGAGSLLDFGF
jgi:hypothetical protein